MPFAVAALAVAVVGTGYSIYSGMKAAGAYAQGAAEQRKANAFQRQQADLQAARQKRDAIRAARLSSAQVQQGAENQGVSGSSSAIGGQGSIQSQMNSNLSFLDQYGQLSDAASEALGRASIFQSQGNQYTANSQMGSAVAGLGFSLFGQSDHISSLFADQGSSGIGYATDPSGALYQRH